MVYHERRPLLQLPERPSPFPREPTVPRFKTRSGAPFMSTPSNAYHFPGTQAFPKLNQLAPQP